NSDGQRALGFSLAHQGKIVDALDRLTRGVGELAPQVLASMLVQRGNLADALAIQGYASRWYGNPELWLAYARTASDAGDQARAARAHARAVELDPSIESPANAGRAAPPEAEPAPRDPIYAQLEAGDHAAAMKRLGDPSW